MRTGGAARAALIPVAIITAVALVAPLLARTGFNTTLIRDPHFCSRFHAANHAIVPILPDGGGECDLSPAVKWAVRPGPYGHCPPSVHGHREPM